MTTHPLIRTASLLLTLALGWPDAHALQINLSFATPGQFGSSINRDRRFAAPGELTGGGDVVGVFNAAADMWEAVLHDDRTFNITVGWTRDFGTATIAASQAGADAFNEIVLSNRVRHFADATPGTNEEFDGFTERFADLGGGRINTGRGFTSTFAALLGVDMLTSALHEIGHVLGNAFDGSPGSGAFIVPTSLPFAGTAMPCFRDSGFCTHIGIASALMEPTGALGLFDRTLISGADLLYVAADGRFGTIERSAVAPTQVPVPPTMVLTLAALLVLGAGRRKTQRQRRPGEAQERTVVLQS